MHHCTIALLYYDMALPRRPRESLPAHSAQSKKCWAAFKILLRREKEKEQRASAGARTRARVAARKYLDMSGTRQILRLMRAVYGLRPALVTRGSTTSQFRDLIEKEFPHANWSQSGCQAWGYRLSSLRLEWRRIEQG